MRWLIAVCFMVATISQPASAQPAPATAPDPALAQLAREYVAVGGAEDMFLEGAKYGFREGARAQGVTFTAEQRQQIDVLIEQHLRTAAGIFVDHIVSFYANNHTAEEFNTALAFYRTPAGERYVGASLEWTFPLSAYLSTQGRASLAPVEEAPSQERLSRARDLAARVIGQLHEADRVSLAGSPIGVEGVTEYIARSFAVSLSKADIDAAIAWTNTDTAPTLEGPSAERTLAAQTATTLAMRAVDMGALQRDVAAVLSVRRSPT